MFGCTCNYIVDILRFQVKANYKKLNTPFISDGRVNKFQWVTKVCVHEKYWKRENRKVISLTTTNSLAPGKMECLIASYNYTKFHAWPNRAEYPITPKSNIQGGFTNRLLEFLPPLGFQIFTERNILTDLFLIYQEIICIKLMDIFPSL